MCEAAVLVPIRKGKTDAWRAALEELVGPRYDEYKSSRERYGLTSQTTFLQRTPMGDFAVIHLTGPDVHASFHRMSMSREPWDVSWREMTLDLHGIDFAKGEKVMPNIQPLFAIEAAPIAGARPFMFAAPLADDKVDAARAVAAELNGARHDDYAASRARLGLEREAVFLQRTPKGYALVFYWMTPDPAVALERLGRSSDRFDRWVMSQAAQLHPVALETLATTVKSNKLIAQFPRAQP